MSLKQFYGYFFYTFYRLWLNVEGAFGAPLRFSKEGTATISMCAVEMWLGFSIVGYTGYFFNIHVHIPFSIVLILCLILLGIHWVIFGKGEWKNYVHEFNKWPKGKNRIGAWIVALISIFIFVSFLYVVHLLNPGVDEWKWK